MFYQIKKELENNYEKILLEYKNFNFMNKHGVLSQNVRDIFYEKWKKEYNLSFKRSNQEHPKNIKTIKKFDHWYAYEIIS